MIIFFYGENSYLSRFKLREVKEKFNRDVDPTGGSFFVVDGSKGDLSEINAKYSPASLFSRKRMVVVDNIFGVKNKNFLINLLNFLEKKAVLDNDNVLLIHDNSVKNKIVPGGGEKMVIMDAAGREKKPDKEAIAVFAFLKKQKFSQEFKKINDLKLPDWIRNEVEKQGVYIDYKAIQTLITNIGSDLWQLAQEINKLVAYKIGADKKNISAEDVLIVSGQNFEENVFSLVDAVGARNIPLSLKILEEQRLAGLSDQYIVTMLFRQFKLIYQTKLFLTDNLTSRSIATELGIHPFVVQKIINQTRNFSAEEIATFLNKLLELDSNNKSGLLVCETNLTKMLIETFSKNI